MQLLFEFLLGIWRGLVPWVRLEPWEAGVRSRSWPWPLNLIPFDLFRIQYKKVGPGGLVWKIPYIDEVSFTNTQRQIVTASRQIIRTLDGKNVTFVLLITYNIKHPDKIWTKVQNFDDSIVALAMGKAAKYVGLSNAVDCTYEKLTEAVFKDVRSEGFNWGVEIESIDLAELAITLSLRLIGDYTERPYRSNY